MHDDDDDDDDGDVKDGGDDGDVHLYSAVTPCYYDILSVLRC